MQEDPELRRTLWFLLGGKRGGENRARIIWSLRAKPSNINQLATELDLQYKSVQHHIRILVGNSLLTPSGEGYGAVYLLNQWLEHHFQQFEQISSKLGFSSPDTSLSRPETQGLDESLHREHVGGSA